MKKILSLLVLRTAAFVQLSAADQYDPQANDAAIVQSGRVRFTVLTPQMIRIQFSAKQQFEDRATFAIVNRRLPVPHFTTREEGGYLYIETSALTLRYRINSVINPAMKSPNNLSITLNVDGHDVVWYPGKEDALNLKGTRRTLDGGSGDNYRPDLEQGIISRAGWAVIDESPKTKRGDGSTTFAFDGQVDGIDWLAEPVDKNAYDWYFMGYGHDYKTAIGDYIKIAGRQPMPPQYVLGYWYSKYQRYSQQDFIDLVNEMQKRDIPLSVMIFDMDWHLDGWTGWTWNKSLIPNPVGLINWMHQRDIRVALNLHPADGVASHEDHYSEISAATGLSEGGRVPWKLEDPKFYQALFQYIIREREKQGVDFWWLDWQQNLTSNYTEGLGETFWCNHVFFNDMRLNRTDRRPLIFHRWGGMGSHRYPIGFSGDTYGTFGSLAWQPYFTATASNVCFGYWGHDIGGHLQIGEKNPELMLRWLQFGVFSPVFRTHGASQWGNERRIWMYENFPLMLQAVNLRYQLMPYIYTAAREAYDTGISICRPLYYDWPDQNEAYRYEGEYMFGDDILVSPVVTAAEDGERTFHKTWLPYGEWYDVCRGRLLNGGQVISDYYAMDEIPYFVKAGAIIPCATLNSKTPSLTIQVMPGSSGSTLLYEDDGDSQDYQNDVYATTSISQQRYGSITEVTIAPRQGSYEGMPNERAYQVVLLSDERPGTVSIKGASLIDWTYDEAIKRTVINVAAAPCSQQIVVSVNHDVSTIIGPAIKSSNSKSSNSKSYDLLGRPTTLHSSSTMPHFLIRDNKIERSKP